MVTIWPSVNDPCSNAYPKKFPFTPWLPLIPVVRRGFVLVRLLPLKVIVGILARAETVAETV